MDNLDGNGRGGDAITLITMHQAKGLEFDAVFIIGMEEGLLPHSRSVEDPAQLEEERRICYVGMTRARKRLYLLSAFQRNFRGNSAGMPSRFLEEIPESAITRDRIRGMRRRSTYAGPAVASHTLADPAPPPASRPRPDYSPGDRVQHTHFGDGVVISAREVRGDSEVTVAFDGRGVKRLMLNFAPLTKVTAGGDEDEAGVAAQPDWPDPSVDVP